MSRPPAQPSWPSSEPDDNDPGQVSPRAVPEGPGKLRPERRPAGILLVSLVVVLEALVLLGAAAAYVYQLLSGAPVASLAGAIFTLGLLLAFSAWLFAVGYFLFQGYRWTRAAALVAQLFVLTIGVPTFTGGLPLPGLAMIVPALAAIVLLFRKTVIAFASRSGGSSPAL